MNPCIDIDKAIVDLRKEYATALNKDFVHKPLSYALFQVWKKFDAIETNRHIDNKEIEKITEYTELIISELKKPSKSEVAINRAIERLTELERKIELGETTFLKCEGYMMFHGTMKITPKAENAEPFEVTTDWLFKPDTCCWYGAGSSYSCDICDRVR